MQYPLPRFFVTLAFAPLLLTLGLSRVQAQDVFSGDTESLGRSPFLSEGLVAGGKRTQAAPSLGIEILPTEARKLLLFLDDIKPEEKDTDRVRRTLESLEKLQAKYTISGRLDEAFVLREQIEEFLARRSGIEPDPGNLTAFRSQVGQVHTFRVTGRRSGPVWGSLLYTDDSDLGSAAVHAGLLREGQRGVVKVTILPGQDQYEGSEGNGITSSSYAAWQGSYTIAPVVQVKRAHDAPMPEEAKKLVEDLTQGDVKPRAAQLWAAMEKLQLIQETAQRAEELDEAIAVRDGIRALIIKLVGARPDPGSLASLRKQVGKSFYFVVTGRATGSVWGDGIYTDDSDLGTAAVHAGLLRPGQKGIIKVTIGFGFEGFDGFERNGIVSGSYGPWQGSYRVSAFRMPSR